MKRTTKLLSWLKSAKTDVQQEITRTEEEDVCEPSTSANSDASTSPTTSATVSKKRHKAVRRYDENYIKFGFIFSGREEEP